MPAHIEGILRTICHHENPGVEEGKEASEAMTLLLYFSRSSELLLPGADRVAAISVLLNKQRPYKSLPHGTRLSLTLADTHGASWSWHRLKGWLVQCRPGCRP